MSEPLSDEEIERLRVGLSDHYPATRQGAEAFVLLERCLVTINVQQTQLDRFREVIADMEEAFAEAYTSQSGRAIFAEWRDALHLVLAGQPPTMRARLAAAEAVVVAAREVIAAADERDGITSRDRGEAVKRGIANTYRGRQALAVLRVALDALTP